jgi:hypothetical protein
MKALLRSVLYSGIISLTAFSSAFAAVPVEEFGMTSAPCASVQFSSEYHPRFNGELSITLVNKTQKGLSHYRVLLMVKKNMKEPFTPANVTENILRFADSDDEVTFPLRNLGFTLMICQGDFDDVSTEFDIKTSRAWVVFDGAEFCKNARSFKLSVN